MPDTSNSAARTPPEGSEPTAVSEGERGAEEEKKPPEKGSDPPSPVETDGQGAGNPRKDKGEPESKEKVDAAGDQRLAEDHRGPDLSARVEALEAALAELQRKVDTQDAKALFSMDLVKDHIGDVEKRVERIAVSHEHAPRQPWRWSTLCLVLFSTTSPWPLQIGAN